MKDKIKEPKEIDDDTNIVKPSPPQPVTYNWNHCVICGLDLSKKGKERVINGTKYVSMLSKKYFTLCSKKICWNCVFNLHKQFIKS